MGESERGDISKIKNYFNKRFEKVIHFYAESKEETAKKKSLNRVNAE